MYQRRRARVLLGVLVFAALVLVTVDFRTGDEGPVDRLRGLATSVLRPIQDGLSVATRPVSDAAGSVTEIFRVRAENDRLRAELEAVSDRHRSSADLQRENEELRALLQMRDDGGFDAIAATTVGIGPSNFEWTMVINAGSEDGVERGMPVINANGLVGRVISVTPNAARVLLAIDPNFSAAARVARNGEVGPLRGAGGNPMMFEPFDPEASIEIGDELVTSSFEGGTYPAGIPIGTVAEVSSGATPLTREVTVRPFVDFARLNHVLVVLSAPVVPPEPLEGTGGLEFVPPDVAPSREPDATDEDEDTDADETEEGDA